MVVETESTNYQPVDHKSDLFIIVHQLAYLNYKRLSDIFLTITVRKLSLFAFECQLLHSFYITKYYTFGLHLKLFSIVLTPSLS
jgi:hypothetical protein